jgi:hypothetical protein
MSTTKRISGSYTIQTINPGDQININSSQVLINGNLLVTGNSTSIVSTDSAITDHTITLNNGITTPNPLGANIIVARSATGSPANVFVSWNESVKAWQLFNGVTVSNIATSVSSGITSVSQDANPVLGGNLNITGRTLYTNLSSGNVQLSANTPGSGGSGIYVTSNVATNAELVTKSKAVAYSIVFG